MKTFLVSLFLCLVAQVSQARMQFEVQPLSIQSRQQVIGVQTDQRSHNQRAIVFTGQAAQQVAQSAGQYVDPSCEMVVATGPEVDDLVGSAVGAAYGLGKLVLVTSAAFAAAGIKLALTAIAVGVGLAWVGIAAGVTLAKTAIYIALIGLKAPFYILAGAGRFFKTRASRRGVYGTYRHACRVPNYFQSYGQHSCAY